MQTHSDASRAAYWQIVEALLGRSVGCVLSGWFVVTRVGFRHDLRVWDVMALRFGEGAAFLTPALLFGPPRLRVHAWPGGIILAALWGAPFIILVALGLRLTSATMASTVTPALMPVFAGLVAWGIFRQRPSRRHLCGYGMIAAGLFALVCAYFPGRRPLGHRRCRALVVAAVLWALYTLRLPRAGFTSLQAAAFICFWSAIALPATLSRTQPFEPVARVRRRARVSVDIPGHHDERGCALCVQPRRRLAWTSRGGRDHCSCAGHDDPLGNTSSRRMAIEGHRQPSFVSSRWELVSPPSRPTRITKREKANDPFLFSPDA